ncbi:MAG: hypothetical protein ACJ768_04635 [Gaiellaceae bacterium]
MNDDVGMFVASGKFALVGPNTAAIEDDMRKIVDSYRIDVEVLDTPARP